MDETLLKFKKERFKRKVKEVFETGKQKVKNGIEYVEEHREIVLPILLGCAAIAKKSAKAYTEHKEEKDRMTRFWDPRAGRYTRTKRVLKDYEEREVERRYADGESYRSILSDMGLTK